MAFLVESCVAIACLWVLRLIYSQYYGGLASIPGPFLAKISNLWKVLAVWHGEMPQKNIMVHEKYGPVVRIGPNHVSFASPAALQAIHGSRNAFPKSDFYKPTSPVYEGLPLQHLFSIQDANYHRTLKKNIAFLYSKTAVLDLETQIDSCVTIFIDQLAELTKDAPANIDMSLWVHLYAFDSLGEINVSKKFGFLEKLEDVRDMIAAADRILYMTGLYAQAPVLQIVQTAIKFLRGVKKTNPLLMYTIAQVNERIKTPKPASDMLNSFLKLHESQPDKLSVKEITGSLYINLMAGHDVLAITLRAIVYYVARNPPVLEKIRKEIHLVALKYSASAHIPYSDITNFAYLDAVIHETLRIHPNTGLILERVVPDEEVTIDGYNLPRGTIVGVNAWVIHRNKEIFGDDIDTFRPERWLDAPNERLNEMKRCLFSFGAGPRTCIGRNIAMMQIGKLIVEFYRRFDAFLTQPEKEWRVSGGWVTKQTNMDMTVNHTKPGGLNGTSCQS